MFGVGVVAADKPVVCVTVGEKDTDVAEIDVVKVVDGVDDVDDEERGGGGVASVVIEAAATLGDTSQKSCGNVAKLSITKYRGSSTNPFPLVLLATRSVMKRPQIYMDAQEYDRSSSATIMTDCLQRSRSLLHKQWN